LTAAPRPRRLVTAINPEGRVYFFWPRSKFGAGEPLLSASWAAGRAAGESRAAAIRMAAIFRVDGMVIGSQKRKRACTVIRRMLPTDVTSPKACEFTAVLMEA